ncbi:uncharacterized protein [Montipora capricornis]|uniref:uncharacterized protein n=1 Tax=Montipora capricornis TaxID=246305 RepID=UPI0035F1D20A
MEFKAFIVFCFAFFVVTVSGFSVSKREATEEKDTVSKYTVKIHDGEKEIDETLEINTEDETETIDVPDDGNTSASAPGAVKSVYDFKRNLAMHRMSNQKACFLSNSTDNLPNPGDLKKVFDEGSSLSPSQDSFEYMVDGTLDDRSMLSDEMKELCDGLPIYVITQKSSVEVEKQNSLNREKRWTFRYRCCWIFYKYCYWRGCCRYIWIYHCYYTYLW